MRTKTWMAGLLLTTALTIRPGAGTATAAALNPAEIPAHATWIIYCNLDAVTRYPEVVQLFLSWHPAAKKHIAQLEQALGIKFPQDFHDVVLTGRGVGPEHGVAIIHVHTSQARVDQFLQSHSAVTISHEGAVAIRKINTPRRTIYEAPAARDIFVVAQSEKLLLQEVRVIRGRAAAIQANSPLLAGGQPDLIVYVAGGNFQRAAALHGAKPRGHHGPGPDRSWIRHVQSGWLACGIHKSQVAIAGRLIADSAPAAAQIVQGAKGMQAMMELGGTGAKASPRQRFMADMMERLSVSAKGADIRIHWSMPLAKLLAALQHEPAASGQP